jgi:hypothetical protein
MKRAALYLPHRNEGRENSEGKLLSAEDAELVKKLSGIEAVFPTEMLSEHLSRMARSQPARTLFTPFQPSEGMSVSRDLALRRIADTTNDPWDGRGSREATFLATLRARYPQYELRDLTPELDKLRLIKSPREIALITKATRLAGLGLMEAMRSTEPGILESELDAVAKYVFHRNGAQGDAYYSLIANGTNAYFPHYNAGKTRLKDGDLLLMDYSPDVGYYMSDITRQWPVNGKFSPDQRDLYNLTSAATAPSSTPFVPASRPRQERGAQKWTPSSRAANSPKRSTPKARRISSTATAAPPNTPAEASATGWACRPTTSASTAAHCAPAWSSPSSPHCASLRSASTSAWKTSLSSPKGQRRSSPFVDGHRGNRGGDEGTGDVAEISRGLNPSNTR